MTIPDRPAVRRNAWSWLGGLLAGGLLMLAATGVAVSLLAGDNLFRFLGELRHGRTLINVGQPTVVRQIQQLQRLETVRFSMDKIISGERNNPYLPKFLVSDRLLLLVHGEVIAGVDLSTLQPHDVSVDGQRIVVGLPTPQILLARVDNEKTRVYSRDTGLFSSPDANLESEVRREAERQLQQAALQAGILKSADDSARATVTSLLTGFGFAQVTFR